MSFSVRLKIPMKTLLKIAAIITTVGHLFGDGLPKENGRLTVQHVLVPLSASQREEIETLDTVTLTSEQWKTVRKQFPDIPKRLVGILPISFNDCLCCVDSFEGVLMESGELAVWDYDLPLTVDGLAAQLTYEASLIIRMDHRGQCYRDGVLIPFDKLLAAIHASRPVSAEQKKEATIEIPPGRNPTDPIFADRLKQLYLALAKKGWAGGDQ